MPKSSIILASASVGRKLLLTKLGIPFSVLISTIDEDAIIDPDPHQMLVKRARAKAEDVVNKLINKSPLLTKERVRVRSASTPNFQLSTNNYLVIAADSMAILGSRTFGKVTTKALGRQLLRDLMGKTHVFTTATCIFHLTIPSPYQGEGKGEVKSQSWESLTHTKVTLRHLPETELEEYASRFDFTRFAAGYALNELPWDLVTKIDGSYTNVIGLPFETLLPILRELDLL